MYTQTHFSFALVGLLVVPWKKSSERAAFSEKMKTLRKELDDVILSNLEHELKSAQTRILDSVSPYRRFVTIEQEKSATTKTNITNIRVNTRKIRSKISEF